LLRRDTVIALLDASGCLDAVEGNPHLHVCGHFDLILLLPLPPREAELPNQAGEIRPSTRLFEEPRSETFFFAQRNSSSAAEY